MKKFPPQLLFIFCLNPTKQNSIHIGLPFEPILHLMTLEDRIFHIRQNIDNFKFKEYMSTKEEKRHHNPTNTNSIFLLTRIKEKLHIHCLFRSISNLIFKTIRISEINKNSIPL